jgi:hypothetical protein
MCMDDSERSFVKDSAKTVGYRRMSSDSAEGSGAQV